MSLGALFVRDKLTTGTLFPALVCPQGRGSQVYDLVLLFFCNQVLVAKNIQLLLSRNWNCRVQVNYEKIGYILSMVDREVMGTSSLYFSSFD